MSRFLPALSLLALLAGCAPPASRIDADLASGRAAGIHLSRVPFEPQKPGHCGPSALSSLLGHWGLPATQEEIGKEAYREDLRGTRGFDLWRQARKRGLAALESASTDPAVLDALLAQGVPVLLNLDLGFGPASIQHYVLAVGRDRTHGWWILHDGRRPDRVVSDAWLLGKWAKTGRWALIAFPPGLDLTGLGAGLHLQAAARVSELGKPEQALLHLQRSLDAGAPEGPVKFRMGLAFKAAGRPREAEKAYREAIQASPGDPDPVNNLALLFLDDASRLNEAEALARTAVTLSRKEGSAALRLPYALDTLGQVLRRQKRLPEARQAFEAALKAAPPDSDHAREIEARLKGL